MASNLDARKNKILKVITDDYIISAEPVGSRTIARQYDLGLSPATIRNEMADLEESGFLEQPHTSSGRIPSEQGYRYYVDSLMSLQKLTEKQIKRIQVEFSKHNQQLEQIIQQASKILVELTEYPSLVLSPQFEASVFRHVQLVRLSDSNIMVLVVTDTGHVENKVVEFEGGIADSELDRISTMLNHRLRGVSIKDLRSTLITEIRNELLSHPDFFNEAIRLLVKAISDPGHQEKVHLNGAIKMLEQPEFTELHKFKPLMDVLYEEKQLYNLLIHNAHPGANINIGNENKDYGLVDCSVITASYEIAGRMVGVIGVLGPTRMDYARVLPIVENTANVLSELLTKLCKQRSK